MRLLEAQIGLGCLDPESGQGTVLSVVVGTSGFAFHMEVNYHFPLHTSVPSKAIQAYLPPEERDASGRCRPMGDRPFCSTAGSQFRAGGGTPAKRLS